jgi:hypothetical protein
MTYKFLAPTTFADLGTGLQLFFKRVIFFFHYSFTMDGELHNFEGLKDYSVLYVAFVGPRSKVYLAKNRITNEVVYIKVQLQNNRKMTKVVVSTERQFESRTSNSERTFCQNYICDETNRFYSVE